jgi:excisionase family DNA binding protein
MVALIRDEHQTLSTGALSTPLWSSPLDHPLILVTHLTVERQHRAIPDGVAMTARRRLITIADAAEELAVCPRTIRRYIATGQLQAIRLGPRSIRVRVDSIEQLVDDSTFGNRTR